MNEYFSLDHVSDPRVRNLVRGLINAADEKTQRDTLINLRKESGAEDAYQAFRFLEHSLLARKFPKLDAFPSSPPHPSDFFTFDAASLEVEISIQRVRIEHHRTQIQDFLQRIGKLNEACFREDEESISEIVAQLTEKFGYSVFLLQKLISIKHLRPQYKNVTDLVQFYIEPYTKQRRDILAVAIEDSIDLSRSYSYVRRVFMDYCRRPRLGSVFRNIIIDHFNPLAQSTEVFAARLLAYSSYSTIDGAIFLCRNAPEINSLLGINAVNGWMPQQIIDTWQALDIRIDLGFFSRFDEDEAKFYEYNFLRHTSSWNEFSDIRRYRRWVESSIGRRLSQEPPGPQAQNLQLTQPVVEEAALIDLVDGDLRSPLSIVNIDPKSAGVLHRTICLIKLLEADDSAGNLSGQQLLRLLDATVDVSNAMTAGEISTFFPSSPNDLLYEYLRSALLYDNEETGMSNHRLRKATQNIVIRQFSRDVVSFGRYLADQGSHVGHHFFATCTESFLTQLFDLYETAREVVEARARLMEWYGERTRDTALMDRAKSLMLESRLAMVRGDIDDNRIYVDPVRFNQWIADNLGDQIRSALPLIARWSQRTVPGPEALEAVSLMQHPEYVMAGILERSFSEFCSNKFFGVDSYMGRRIRHGTLRGVMITEVRALLEKSLQDDRLKETLAYDRLQEWFEKFDRQVEYIGGSLLHLRSDGKKRGGIVPTITSSEKSLTLGAALDFIVLNAKGENPVPSIVSAIQEYCWMILEVDLKRIRAEISHIHSLSLIEPRTISAALDVDLASEINENVSLINQLVARKFNTLTDWLTKPQNVSPSTTFSLLFNAVLTEVREQVDKFLPDAREVGLIDLDLYGHRYHYVYDILYILVNNAARSGRLDGVLVFEVKLIERGVSRQVLSLEVESEFARDGKRTYHVDRIAEAMDAEFDDAMIREGFSGIRKIKHIASMVEEIDNFSFVASDETVRFRIQLTFPVA